MLVESAKIHFEDWFCYDYRNCNNLRIEIS
jgi:hypothetical protein